MTETQTPGKRISISDDIRSNPGLERLIPPAREALQEETGGSFERLSEEWRLVRDEFGRTLITLRVTDPWGDGEAIFAPDELSNLSTVRRRMNRLWGDVLQNSTRLMRENFNLNRAASDLN